MRSYGWIIDYDYIAEKGNTPGTFQNAKGLMGPNLITGTIERRLKDGEGRHFRLLDNDCNVYYQGRIITADDGGSETDFAPLDNFGEGNAGCTSIEYQDEAGHWRIL